VPTGLSEHAIVVRNAVRHYLLYVPPNYTHGGTPRRLVFAFHGRTGTPRSLRSYLRLEAEAGDDAIFVYPAGLRAVDPDSGRSLTEWQLRRDGDDVALFDALLAQLAQAYCVDRGQVFAVGHSAGAVMTNALGCARGNVLRAVAPIAGTGPEATRCTAQLPAVWITHGRTDGPVPFHEGETTRDRWVAAAGCTPAPAPAPALASGAEDDACQRFTGCRGEARVEFCPHPAGHSPPPFAPHAIWTFFTRP
jgi:poly(3-hydroxybutyrate) depolymerase